MKRIELDDRQYANLLALLSGDGARLVPAVRERLREIAIAAREAPDESLPEIDGQMDLGGRWTWGSISSWLVIGWSSGRAAVLAARRTDEDAADEASPDKYPGWEKLLVAELTEVSG